MHPNAPLDIADADLNRIRGITLTENMIFLHENAINKMLAGTTTLEEVLRVTWEQV